MYPTTHPQLGRDTLVRVPDLILLYRYEVSNTNILYTTLGTPTTEPGSSLIFVISTKPAD